MPFIVLAGFMLVPAIYQLIAIFLKVPSFKMSSYINGHLRRLQPQKSPFEFLSTLSKPVAKYIPLSLAKEVSLERMLKRAGNEEAPREYTARLTFTFLFIAVFALPLIFVSPWLALLPLLGAGVTVFIINEETKDKSEQLQRLIEDEIPRMVESLVQKLSTQRNVIAVFDSYIQNYDTYLSRELAKTVADMRTGSPETALQRFELRMNNPILSQFVRGILATMHGENMTIYFNELVSKVSTLRKQRLTEKALKIKPKISTMSMLRAFWSIGVLIAVIGMGLMSVMK